MSSIKNNYVKQLLLIAFGMFFLLISGISFLAHAQDKSREIDVIYSKLAKVLPEDSMLIAVPYADSLNAYGANAQGKVNEQSDIFGGKAYEVKVKKSKNAYDAGVTLQVNPAVKKGEVIYLTFFAKALTLPAGKETIEVPGIGVQLNSPPYNHLFSNTAQLTSTLGSFSYAGRADRDYGEGELQVSFQIATDTQAIAFGPVFVFKMSGDTDIASLPYIN